MRLPGNLEKTRIENGLCRSALARIQSGQGEERFDRRAGRISAAQRTIEQRLVGRLVQLLPTRRINAVDKQVRVVTRLRNEREHIARARIDRAPRRSPNAASAACCNLMSSDSRRLLPETGGVRDNVRTARPFASTSTSSQPVVPCNSCSYDNSTPTLP